MNFLVHESCLSLGITIIGGHTEVTSAVTKPVACVTMFGAQKRRILATEAREDDVIIMTKSCGLEGVHFTEIKFFFS
jgi:hydrogenase expression/formation protein HypE